MRVKVQRIESIRDPEGNLGKRIELVEESLVPRFAIRPPTDEARMAQEVLKTLQQQLPILGMQPQLNAPKIILFFTERECEELGIDFNVNQIYEIRLGDKALRFEKVS